MSVTATGWAEQQPLSGRKKHLLLAIARAVDETGSWRSVTQAISLPRAVARSARCTGWSRSWPPLNTSPIVAAAP